jgi:hypothetical protein
MNSPTDDDQNEGALKSPLPRPSGRNANAGGGADADVEKYARPDVSADRDAAAEPAAPDEGEPQTKKPPLGIKQIEDLEDDAMGG